MMYVSGCDITKVSESMQHDFESLNHTNSYVTNILSTEPNNGNPKNYLHL